MKKKQTLTLKTTIPNPVLVGETRLLYDWCQSDRDELLSFGLDWQVIEELPDLCSKSESLFAQYQVEKITLAQFRRTVAKKFSSAMATRTRITERIRYALYVAKSDKQLDWYRLRRTRLEIIEDLFNLADMCVFLRNSLENVGFNADQADSVKRLAEELQSVSIELFKRELDCKDVKKEYYTAYTNLYSSVQLIRKCAFEVFPPGSPRRKGYQSEYRITHR
jgi:hypothetical protein